MKYLVFIYLLITITIEANGQETYSTLIDKGVSLRKENKYKEAALSYSHAFSLNGWKGQIDDRYNAACCWALAGIPDSAIYNLQRVADKGYYFQNVNIETDADLISLHTDLRWKSLLDQLAANKLKVEKINNGPLARELDSIQDMDQKYRHMLNGEVDAGDTNTYTSEQILEKMQEVDFSNLVRIKQILDRYGWPGRDLVGDKGSAVFLVIQHADLQTQEHYLPMMKEAVKNGKANAYDLALLEDRIEMRNNRPQIYGSQITMKDGKTEIYQIIDEKNVNKRRADVGLEPLEEYVKNWGIEYTLPK